ncbi:helix-turn-helix domain-containing protein [Fructilactobacillus cliffordii]|uniref:helix-turn-helix domain-containing protein n=1 Tax=Fructilactobacillus cliffordii TaxID=2940299 RepID=UPI00209312F7|nr:helix-turn-helix transcriptional regulator [Fructilactobacillus cliffordii]USS86186.1 helix-turn-helix domain-containing protein [Fructilactobacillus cliffordii]
MELADRLKTIRQDRQLTQAEVAQQLNVSRKTVSSWENGRSTASLDDLRSLATLYHVSVAEFLDEQPQEQNHSASPYRNRLIRYKRWGYFSKYAYYCNVLLTGLALVLLVLPFTVTKLLIVPPLVLTLVIIILCEQRWQTITTNRPFLWKLVLVTPILLLILFATGYLLNGYVYHSLAFMHQTANWMGLLLLAITTTAGVLMTIIFPLKRLTVKRSTSV